MEGHGVGEFGMMAYWLRSSMLLCIDVDVV